jgi:hypothetical protein
VYSINGVASEPTKNSFFPIPIASGLPNLAAINSLGFLISKTTIPYAPITLLRPI